MGEARDKILWTLLPLSLLYMHKLPDSVDGGQQIRSELHNKCNLRIGAEWNGPMQKQQWRLHAVSYTMRTSFR